MKVMNNVLMASLVLGLSLTSVDAMNGKGTDKKRTRPQVISEIQTMEPDFKAKKLKKADLEQYLNELRAKRQAANQAAVQELGRQDSPAALVVRQILEQAEDLMLAHEQAAHKQAAREAVAREAARNQDFIAALERERRFIERRNRDLDAEIIEVYSPAFLLDMRSNEISNELYIAEMIEQERLTLADAQQDELDELDIAHFERFVQEEEERFNAAIDGFYQDVADRNTGHNTTMTGIFNAALVQIQAMAPSAETVQAAQAALSAGLTRYLLPTVGLVVGTAVTQFGLGYMPSVEEAAMVQGTAAAIVLGGNSFYNAYNQANRVNVPFEQSKSDDKEVVNETSLVIYEPRDNA